MTSIMDGLLESTLIWTETYCLTVVMSRLDISRKVDFSSVNEMKNYANQLK